MKLITKMNEKDTKRFLLKGNSFFTLDLPIYFNFNNILINVDKKIKNKNLQDLCKLISKKSNSNKKSVDLPKNYENVNFKMINNKDGKYAWRPFEIIHPVIYVCLVNKICNKENWEFIKKRFRDFQKNKNIICCSIPGESNNKKADTKANILRWWSEFEQRTISLSLEYKYMASTDITNCYPSIYTHSISWALHKKEFAKEHRKKGILGNDIDQLLQEMSYGQTNGIPQGSVITDLLAEIILGYADELLTNKLRIEAPQIVDYKILRYRDDYRLFCNNTNEMDIILKFLTETLAELNFKLNNEKTFCTSDIISNSIKKDKLYRFQNPISEDLNFQKQLFLIRYLGIQYPNSGSLTTLLTHFYHEQIENMDKRPNSYEQVISIVVDIMYINPRTYPICCAILSKILTFINSSKREKILKSIIAKFKDVANTEYLEIWLQRITLPYNKNKDYNCKLCQKLYNDSQIWNSDWLKNSVDELLIIDKDELNKLKNEFSKEEVDKFTVPYDY